MRGPPYWNHFIGREQIIEGLRWVGGSLFALEPPGWEGQSIIFDFLESSMAGHQRG